MKLDFQKLLRSMSAVSAWLLQHHCLYWSKQSYQFSPSNGDWVLQPVQQESSAAVLVVARDSYQEFSKAYPVTGLRELAAVLQHEYAGKQLVKHLIGPVQDSQRRVVSYVFDNQAAAVASRAWLVLPETLLLWRGQREAALLAVEANQPYFLNLTGDLPISLKKNPVIHSLQAFAASTGVNHTLFRETSLSSQQLALQLARGFQAVLGWSGITAFLQLPGTVLQVKHLKTAAFITSATAAIYLALSSFYLDWRIGQQQAAIKALGSEVSALLDTQQVAEQQSADLQRYAENQQSRRFSGHMWLLVQQLLAGDESLELVALYSEDEAIILRGRVLNATQMLSVLQQNPLVVSARFSAPVTKEADKESFVVNLVLRQQSNHTAGGADAK